MSEKQDWLRNYGYLIFFSSLSFFIYIVLFFVRSFDDNRTTSWHNVFTAANPAIVFSLIVICSVAAWLLSRLSLAERHPSLFLAGFSFVIAASFWNEPEIIVDASRYFAQAKYLELYGVGFFLREWGRAIAVWTDLPVVPFFYGLIFKVFGENRIYIQIFTTLLFSLSTVLTYLIGKKLWDADTGFYAGLLLLGIPYLFSQVPLMLVDVPAMFFLLLAIFSYIYAIEEGKILWIFLSSVAITLAFYSKYSLWMMLSVLIVIALTYRNALPELRTSAYVYRICSILGVAVFLIGTVFAYNFDSMSEQIRLLFSYQRPGLRRWGESFPSTFFFQIHPLISLAAVCSVYEAWRKKDIRYLGVLWLVALVFFFRIRRIRYMIMVFPMLTLMASYGLQRIRQKAVVRFIALSVVAFSVTVGVFGYLPFLKKNSAANLEKAGRYLDSLGIAEAEVYTVFLENSFVNPAVAVPVLDLFTKKQLIYNYRGKKLSDEELSRSPFRFSWEYKNPRYYEVTEENRLGKRALVLISDGVAPHLPEYIQQKIAEYRNSISFEQTDFIYEYQSVVTVYSSDESRN
jgi:4-amino-4-deoxy-L-arabinose transferase-like glycosyltransferase